MYYLIRLKNKNLKIEIYDEQMAEQDKKFFKVKNVLDLNKCSYDHRVFDSFEKAEKFREDYLKTLKNLDNKKICVSRELPAILYKRRYMILTLLGLKMQTVRNYRKDWIEGQAVNLHDQTFFLTVIINKITDLKDGTYRYDFEMP